MAHVKYVVHFVSLFDWQTAKHSDCSGGSRTRFFVYIWTESVAFCIRCTRSVPSSLSNSVCIDVHIYLSQRARGLAIACNKNTGQRPRFSDVVCSSCHAFTLTINYAIGSVQKDLSATGPKCIRGQVHNACARLEKMRNCLKLQPYSYDMVRHHDGHRTDQ